MLGNHLTSLIWTFKISAVISCPLTTASSPNSVTVCNLWSISAFSFLSHSLTLAEIPSDLSVCTMVSYRYINCVL